MVASSIPCKLSLRADRAHACAGDSHVSSGIDVACPTTQSVLAIASLHELHGDSWPSSSTGTRSFCCNQQFSITAITTSTGAIAERYAYTAYGQPTVLDASGTVISATTLSNRYTYTGRAWDSTLGLHHFRARWMSGLTGRFLTRDPMKYFAGLNLYGNYLSQDRLDPSGLQTEFPAVQDLPAITLPIITIGPIDPLPRVPTTPPVIVPPGLDVHPIITCAQFVGQIPTLAGLPPGKISALPPAVITELRCNPYVFCANPCQQGSGPGNQSFTMQGRCNICLNSRQFMTVFDWIAILTHEMTHCTQYRTKLGLCGCPNKPYTGPQPPLPPLSKGNYDACLTLETEAYTAQCTYLFPTHPALRQQCINAGVCKSCKHYPNAPQNCPPWPDDFIL